MKVQVVGVGMLGSTVAKEILDQHRPGFLHLVDTDFKRARGEALDLKRVVVQRGYNVMISCSDKAFDGYDFTIVSLGKRGEYDKHSEEEAEERMYDSNFNSCVTVCDRLTKGRVIVLTHPAKTIAETLRSMFRNLDVVHSGDVIDGIADGKEITLLKGYTNWGAAVEASNMIKGVKHG